MTEEVKPFKINIPDSELDLLRKKVELARLPDYEGVEWGEEDEGGVTSAIMRETVDHWRTKYDWRAVEARLNQMPQYKTSIKVDGFDAIDVHFVHAKTTKASGSRPPTPLLFMHGWPGSFIEVEEILPLLLDAGFHVVAPSLAGFGFSSYPRQAGFSMFPHAQVMHRLMVRLGYDSYVVQGGDFGSLIGRTMALQQPDHVKALHVNMLVSAPHGQLPDEDQLTERERKCAARARLFTQAGSAYQAVHRTKPRTIGYAFHDSPVGMLAWMADKLMWWSDRAAKTWTPDELITWTLMHYFPGPTTAMVAYRENQFHAFFTTLTAKEPDSKVPIGFSHFPKELNFTPKPQLDKAIGNLAWMREHDVGGHFAASERPAVLAADVIEFFGPYRQ
ncbi:hypothetical protein MAPG_02004 [Magnaporthiopsis poae ATCC 64411]|uniref:Epoxide hydrolase N-terminal domain-containing protein n=1 Tax=Magnaporthiopsis poae (strain ATCC 64411 / 73-15) TaxID=644358 RepID=A0A0C4DQ66_MAGP6|nr:hypothetical protein MAPG_02004 [Magnaporthiopsis poae ATCC 64411]